jgi:hypothetical protein
MQRGGMRAFDPTGQAISPRLAGRPRIPLRFMTGYGM